MLAKFNSKKAAILDALQKPFEDEDYEDNSPKGSVDEEIRGFMDEINKMPDYATSSSCAGRVAVYLEGERKSQARPASADEKFPSKTQSIISTSSGGKGGGRWLFTSHQPVDLQSLSTPGALLAKLGLPVRDTVAFPPASTTVRFVRLKFEPFILQTFAASAESAQTMLKAGMDAGFRESGISGIVDSKGRPSMPMVSIRSSGMTMDCTVGFLSDNNRIQAMVPEQYLWTVVKMANERFKENLQRTERFRENLLESYADYGVVPGDVLEDDSRKDFRRKAGFRTGIEEKAAKRRNDMREREAALKRRTEQLHRGGALDGAADVEDDLDLGVLDLH